MPLLNTHVRGANHYRELERRSLSCTALIRRRGVRGTKSPLSIHFPLPLSKGRGIKGEGLLGSLRIERVDTLAGWVYNQVYRGVEQWQLVGLITQRSLVRIQPPLPNEIRRHSKKAVPFYFAVSHQCVLV
jgi:hypothetical protein